MAWNQPGEDNKKRPPPRGAPDQSSLEEMLRRWQQRVQRLWQPGRGAGTAAIALVTLVLAVWLGSGYYQIDTSERGIVQRFGRFITVEAPGHGWHWPWPIETLRKLNVGSIDGVDSKALMLTADQSLIDISWSVQYRINDPVQFLFQVRAPESTLRQTSETVLRELVAHHDLQSLLTGDARATVTSEARKRIQSMLDGYRAGVALTSVNMTDVQLPDAIVAAQRDTEKAAEDHQRAIADANAFQSDILPKAQGAAQRQLAEAQVYASQTVANAEGEAERFNQLVGAYTQSPEVTRSRLYMDTMEEIYSRSHKIFLDTKGAGGSVVYLPLDKLAEVIHSAAPATSAAGASAADSGAAASGQGAAGSAVTEPVDRSRDRTER
jgi:membrane protease subunit HflK